MIYRRTRPLSLTWLLFAVTLLLACGGLTAQSLGSAFTYQGQLTELGQPASGLYDLQVCLFDTPGNPIPMACAPDFSDVPVEAGLFAITLDFGSAPFVGQQRFLELRVRPGASVSGYTILAPRQLIRPAPEALRANVAASAPWSGLTGVPAGFADGVDNDSGGTVTSVATGAGLTGGPITGSGTVAIANSGVTSVMIASGAVGTPQLANNAVNSAQIADGTIVAADMASDSVTAAQLSANAVDTTAIADANVTTAKIATGAVGGTQINVAQVQVRVTGICPLGEYMRGVNADGSVICQSSSAPAGALNDTGIDWCANATTNNLTCPQTAFLRQDGDYGRDARARAGLLTKIGGGEGGFDYTKISNIGNALPANAALGAGANDWGCTRDNVSGLIWEVKVNNVTSLRHWGHVYTWFDTNAAINGGNAGYLGAGGCNNTISQCNTSAFVAAVNAEGLCGANNWRMPTPGELQGITHYGHFYPTIDQAYFPNAPTAGSAVFLWSGKNFASNASSAWGVYFSYGDVTASDKSLSYGVRVVRGEQ